VVWPATNTKALRRRGPAGFGTRGRGTPLSPPPVDRGRCCVAGRTPGSGGLPLDALRPRLPPVAHFLLEAKLSALAFAVGSGGPPVLPGSAGGAGLGGPAGAGGPVRGYSGGRRAGESPAVAAFGVEPSGWASRRDPATRGKEQRDRKALADVVLTLDKPSVAQVELPLLLPNQVGGCACL
jgi:hypothetical protein